MNFNFTKEKDIEKCRAMLEYFISKKSKSVKLVENSPTRTLSANSLFHVWIAIFADHIGETSREACKRDVKRELLGQKICKNVFTGTLEYDDYKTSEMTTAELADFMNKFKIWANTEYNCYLPYKYEPCYSDMIEMYK